MKNWIAIVALALFLVPLLGSSRSEAHPGETDSKGCHVDSNGRYHCH